MAKNIYSILSSFKTDEENEEDYIVKKEDFVQEESSPSDDDLTEISPESLIRILEKKEMFMEKKSKVCSHHLEEAFQSPEQPLQPKEAFETPEEPEKVPETPEETEEAPETPEEPEEVPETPEETEEPEKAPEEPEKVPKTPEEPKEVPKTPEEPKEVPKTPKEPEPVVIKKEVPKVNHQIQIQNLLRESQTNNPLKKLTNEKKSMYSNVIKYESVRTRFF